MRMMTNLSEMKSELADLDRLLHATWLREREDARRRITELAVEFQLSPTTVARDIEAALRSAAPLPPMLRAPTVDLPLRKEGAAQHIEAKYRDATTGDTWTGRGPRPRWLRDALDAGGELEDYVVRNGEGLVTANPLREFENAAHQARVRQGR
jgi:DNA-binding protein H-NS